MDKRENLAVRVGIISLPVMACILAGILFEIVHSDPRDIPAIVAKLDEMNPHAEVAETKAAEAQTALQTKVAMLEQMHERLAENAELVEAIQRAETQITEAEQRAELLQKLDEIRASIAELADDDVDILALQRELERIAARLQEFSEEEQRLKEVVSKSQIYAAIQEAAQEIEALERQISELESEPPILSGLGDFPRPFMSIECRRDVALIYVPGQEPRRVTPPFSAVEKDRLVRELEELEGVVFLVRQEGFDTYDTIYWQHNGLVADLRYERIDAAWSDVPIKNNETIWTILEWGSGQ